MISTRQRTRFATEASHAGTLASSHEHAIGGVLFAAIILEMSKAVCHVSCRSSTPSRGTVVTRTRPVGPGQQSQESRITLSIRIRKHPSTPRDWWLKVVMGKGGVRRWPANWIDE
jgi:hypothetical protein